MRAHPSDPHADPCEPRLERLDRALEGAQVGTWEWDLRDDSVRFDTQWCAMLGLDPLTTPMTLASWSTRVHPDDLDECFVDVRAHIEGRTARYENVHRLQHADGSWRYILDRGRVSERAFDGQPVRVSGVHVDITETALTKRVADEEHAMLARLMAEVPTGVALFDERLRCVAANEAWKRALGLETRDCSGRSFFELEDGAGGADLLCRVLAGERLAGVELPWPVTEGAARAVRWSMGPWVEGDAISGVLVVLEGGGAPPDQPAA